jgi:archaellum component FlaC
LEQDLEAANVELSKQEKLLGTYEASLDKADKKVKATQDTVDKLTENLDGLNKEFSENSAQKTQTAFNNLRNTAKNLGIDLKNIPTEYTEENFK